MAISMCYLRSWFAHMLSKAVIKLVEIISTCEQKQETISFQLTHEQRNCKVRLASDLEAEKNHSFSQLDARFWY